MELFSVSWAALRSAIADLPDEAFAEPSGCSGWLVRDLVCHLIIDAQDVLITLVSPADTGPTRDALTYWEVTKTLPTGDDPLDAVTVRLAAAYEDPGVLKFHLDDVGSAAGRAAELCDPELLVGTRGQVLTAGDYLSAYVIDAGTRFPESLSDEDALLVGTGRRGASDAEAAALGELVERLPYVLG